MVSSASNGEFARCAMRSRVNIYGSRLFLRLPFRYSLTYHGTCIGMLAYKLTCALHSHSDGTKSVPGCRGDGVPDVDYCTKDPDLEEDAPSDLGKDFDTLTFIGDNFQGLGKCSGDCDDDDDCQGNLECFKRGDD